MQKIKTLLVFCCLLCCYCCLAQDFKSIPDSLKKYNHVDLMDKINIEFNENIINYKKIYIYAQINLLKAQKENNIQEIVYGYNALTDAVENLELKLKYSDTAISIANNKMPTKLSYLHYCRGIIFYNQNRLKEALNWFLIANKESNNSSLDLNTRINYSIAIIKKTQGNYQEALLMFKKCEEIAKENKYPNYLRYLFGLSELYNRMDQIDLSEQYTNRGLDLRKKDASGEYYYPYFISNKGKNYYKRKEYNKAILQLISSSKSFQINNDYSNYAENSYYIGECYRELNQDEKAMMYYKKIDSIFIAKKDIYPLIISAYEHLITYYKKKKNYQQTIHFSDQFIKADKVLDDNYKYIASKIAKTYDIQQVVAEKQAVIASLTSDKKTSLITIILLLLGIILLVFWFYKYYKQKKKELQKQKVLFEAYIAAREQKREPKVILTNLYDDNPIQNPPLLEKSDTTLELEPDTIEKETLLGINPKVVAEIMNWLEIFKTDKWFLETYTVDELAKKIETNSTYLSRVIKETTGCSYPQYLNTLRIEYIIDKLVTEKNFLKYSVQALSESSGYNSVDTFVRAFVLHTKMKPSNFVKQLKNKYL